MSRSAVLAHASAWCPIVAALLLGGGSALAQESPDTIERTTRYLEMIQENIHRQLGTKPRVYDRATTESVASRYIESQMPGLPKEKRDEYVRQLVESIAEDKSRSKYEDLLGFAIVQSLNRRIQAVLARNTPKLGGVPVFGTLPTRQVNARTFAVPGTSNVVIAFEDQLFTFALLFSKAVAYAYPEVANDPSGRLSFSTDHDHIQKRVEENPEASRRFIEVLLAYTIAGAPGAAPQYFQAPPHSQVAEILRNGMELFILGHEYGHFMANHVREGREVRSAVGDAEVTEIMRSWQDEYEADAYGLLLAVAAMRKEGLDVALSYWGAELFFDAFEIVHRALHVLRTGTEPPARVEQSPGGSHPPPALRRQFLRAALEKFYTREEAQAAVGLADSMNVAVEALWSKTLPVLKEAHKSGRRPHRLWNSSPN